MILSAFCLPSAGLSAILAGGLGFLPLILTTELPEIVHCIGGLIAGKHCVMLCAGNPCVRVFAENCLPFRI